MASPRLVKASTSSSLGWLTTRTVSSSRKIQAAVKADPRAVEDAELAESMMSETLGVLNLADGRSCAVVHERGRPRWGPVRNSKSLVDKDRKDMKNAIRSGTLDALLLAYRRDII